MLQLSFAEAILAAGHKNINQTFPKLFCLFFWAACECITVKIMEEKLSSLRDLMPFSWNGLKSKRVIFTVSDKLLFLGPQTFGNSRSFAHPDNQPWKSSFIQQLNLFSRDLFCLRQCWVLCLWLVTKLLQPEYQQHGMISTYIWTFDGWWKVLWAFSPAVFKINVLQNKSKEFRFVHVLSEGSLLWFHAHVLPSS